MKILLLITLLIQVNISYGENNLEFLNDQKAYQILVRPKIFQDEKSWTYFDALGREAYFRGWNVSGSVKLISMGFKPFKTLEDANKAFKTMAKSGGSNAVRFTISWEGVNPDVDQIDKKYLEDITAQIKAAIKYKIYVILDYHQDLFSRHLFNTKSKTTGNGAPKYIIDGGIYPKKNCKICFLWAMNYVLHPGVKLAFRNFWNNSKITTSNGEKFIQSEFLWQMEKTLAYLKENLNSKDFLYVLGLDPFNEPNSGGRQGLELPEWNQTKLYPFYFKVRNIMEKTGWNNKILFAEPIMDLGAKDPFYPEFLKNPPKEGWSFNTHFYDVHQIKIKKNGAYLNKLEEIKKNSLKANLPLFLTEFGYWKQNTKVQNQARIINAIYQGMEISKEKDSNFVKFYSPSISGTQWNWDIYHNSHQEPLNFTDRILTEADAWNGENYSVITNGGKDYDAPDKFLVERSYPKRCQGEILHFYYNARPFDGRKEILDWGAIKFSDSNDLYLKESRFLFLAFKGINSIAPTELFIPSHFEKNSTFLITENKIFRLNQQDRNIKVTNDTLYYWAEKNPRDLYFVLLVEGSFSIEYLKSLQKKLVRRVFKERKSPVFLTGKVRSL